MPVFAGTSVSTSLGHAPEPGAAGPELPGGLHSSSPVSFAEGLLSPVPLGFASTRPSNPEKAVLLPPETTQVRSRRPPVLPSALTLRHALFHRRCSLGPGPSVRSRRPPRPRFLIPCRRHSTVSWCPEEGPLPRPLRAGRKVVARVTSAGAGCERARHAEDGGACHRRAEARARPSAVPLRGARGVRVVSVGRSWEGYRAGGSTLSPRRLVRHAGPMKGAFLWRERGLQKNKPGGSFTTMDLVVISWP